MLIPKTCGIIDVPVMDKNFCHAFSEHDFFCWFLYAGHGYFIMEYRLNEISLHAVMDF